MVSPSGGVINHAASAMEIERSPTALLWDLSSLFFRIMTILTFVSNHAAGCRYSGVMSWMLDFDGNEIDERTHGFIFNSCITSEQRISRVSDALGTRMWCDIESEYIDPADFDSNSYDSSEELDGLSST